MSKASVFYQREGFIYFFAICVSSLLSLGIANHQEIINPDAICYLTSAEEIGKSGLHAAMQICGQAKWPIYPLLIYGLAQISHCSYSAAAYLLNGLFSLISVVAFILITKELGGSRRILWLAAFTILLSHKFNNVREYIIRDHGFWAFYLLSILLLLRYFRQPGWMAALFWSGSILLATLFRLEGAIFLFLLPFLSWMHFFSLSERFKSFLKLNLLTIIICFVLIAWLLLYPQSSLEKFGRLNEIIHQVHHGLTIITNQFAESKVALAQYVLTGDSTKEAGSVLLMVMGTWYVVSVINNLSWIYSALLIYAWWRKVVTFSFSATLILSAYLGINILVTLSFLFERLFLSHRYLIALSLVFMLWIPFALEDLLQKYDQVKYRFVVYASIVLMVIASLGGIFDFGYSKTYIYEAGQWLAEHVPAQATLYSNDYQVMYYSHHFGNTIFQKVNTDTDVRIVSHGKWKQYDYLALRIKTKHTDEMSAILKEIHQAPVRIFNNKRGDRVEVYHINKRIEW
ncbi:MAG TPA: hypothetical protein VJN02_10360 [Gammaproteobacteria bacterium]|nr:hypothetical protein [Gammaproteobacteria bacterium]